MASKIKYEDVKKDIENLGWQLKSTEYINLKTDLEISCPEGHLNYVPYEKFRKGTYICPICTQNKFKSVDLKRIKKNGFRVLAFDQASITSGWSVFDGDDLITFGKYTSSGTKNTERIAQTKQWIASMINKWQPDLIVFEDIQLQKFTTKSGLEGDAVLVFKKLAHLQGVLKNYCYELGLPYEVVPPATWRAYSDVKGQSRNDKKKNAQLKIKKFYGADVTQDEADAILIGRWAASRGKNNQIIMF